MPPHSASHNKNKRTATDRSSILDALQGKNMEIIVAALLLTGKLHVDSVTLYREATLIIGLTGKYKTLGNFSNLDNMVNFIKDNKDMTLDEVIRTFQKK
ncbi:hypothetical protein VN24_04910 [Paenibacillus beijingensis]|uniref:Uncharacterized protein n=1 Tax=Paenibacillus beijingensis TaxID=1126833 RepID=A0A0D5NRI5_9BACL|nr:hypothetical protein VN24_04910 [Paenibacillus beijingensis]